MRDGLRIGRLGRPIGKKSRPGPKASESGDARRCCQGPAVTGPGRRYEQSLMQPRQQRAQELRQAQPHVILHSLTPPRSSTGPLAPRNPCHIPSRWVRCLGRQGGDEQYRTRASTALLTSKIASGSLVLAGSGKPPWVLRDPRVMPSKTRASGAGRLPASSAQAGLGWRSWQTMPPSQQRSSRVTILLPAH